MPYKSQAQAAKMNIMAKQGKSSKVIVDEFNKASKGLKLPKKLKKK